MSQLTPSKLTTWIRRSFRSRSRSPKSKKNLAKAMELVNKNAPQCGSGCVSKSADESVNKPYAKNDKNDNYISAKDSQMKDSRIPAKDSISKRSVSATRGMSTSTSTKSNITDNKQQNTQTNTPAKQTNLQANQTKSQSSQGNFQGKSHANLPTPGSPCIYTSTPASHARQPNRPNYHRHRGNAPSPRPEGKYKGKMGSLRTNGDHSQDPQETENDCDSQVSQVSSRQVAPSSQITNQVDTNGRLSKLTKRPELSNDGSQKGSAGSKFASRFSTLANVLPSKPQHPTTISSSNLAQRHSNVAPTNDSNTPAASVALATSGSHGSSDVNRESRERQLSDRLSGRLSSSPVKMGATDTHTTQTQLHTQQHRHSRTPTIGPPSRTAACSPDSAVHSPGSAVSPGLDSDTSYYSDSKAFQDVQKKMQRIKSDLGPTTENGLLMDIKDTYNSSDKQERQSLVSASSLNSRSTTPLVQDCFTKKQIYNVYKIHKSDGVVDTKVEMFPQQQVNNMRTLEELEKYGINSYTDVSDAEIAGYLRPRSRSSDTKSRRSISAGSRSNTRHKSVSPRRCSSQDRSSVASSVISSSVMVPSLASNHSGSRRSLKQQKIEVLNERNNRRSRSQQSLSILRDLPGFVPQRSVSRGSRASTLSVMETKLLYDQYDDEEDEGCSSDSSLSYASTCSSDEDDYEDVESGFHPVIQRLQQHPRYRSQSSLSHYSTVSNSYHGHSYYSNSMHDTSYHRYPTPTVDPSIHDVSMHDSIHDNPPICQVHGPVLLQNRTLQDNAGPLSPIGPVAPRTTLEPSPPQGQMVTKNFLMTKWWSTLKDNTNVAQQGSLYYEEEEHEEDDDSTCKDNPDLDVSMATTASYIPGVTLADKLRLAASKGQMDKVKELICNGATFEADREGRTALHYAALNGYAQVVEMLAVEGSSIDSQDNLGYTALHRAAAQGHLDVIKVLLAEGCMIDRQDEVHHNTALHEAAWNGLSKSLEFLIKSNADVNIVNKAGFSALHLCCQNGHNQSARTLLYGGAGTSLKNNYGDTPLHTGARYGHAGVTRILLSAKCDGNEQNKNGDTPLHISAALKRRKIAKLLVDHFVNVSVKNKQNEMAIDVARRKDHTEIIEIILSQPKPPKGKKIKKSKTDGEKKEKKSLFFWKKKDKEKAVEAAQYAAPPKSQGIPSIAPSIAAPSEISSCRQLDHFPGYKQSMHSIPSQVKTTKSATTRGVGTTAGSQVSLASKQGYLSQYTAQEGVQYYKDLAGNVKQGPIGFAPVCNCGPLIKRLEQKVDADKANFYDHVDATKRMLSDRMRTVAQSLEQGCKDRHQSGKRERDDAIHRRAVKDRMELERHLDLKQNDLRSEMKNYVDAKLNNIVSQDDCCNWHHSACKNYHGMRRMPRESTPKTNLYRSKSDETLSSLGLSVQDTHRVSRTQAQAMRDLRKKSKKENREPQSLREPLREPHREPLGEPQSHRAQVYPPPRDSYKMQGRSPEGSSSHGEIDESELNSYDSRSWTHDAPYRPSRQPMISPLASVPEDRSNTFSDSSLQPHQLADMTDESLEAAYSSPVYPSMEIPPNMKVYHSKTDSGSNPDSGYSNSSHGNRAQPVDDQHNTSSVTNESGTTEGSGSSLRSSMSLEKSGDQPLPSSRQYFNTVSNQMEMWYERRLREMEKNADDHTKQQSDVMQSQMKHIEERIAINRLRMKPTLESTTGTEV